jgi:hypothetical protein
VSLCPPYAIPDSIFKSQTQLRIPAALIAPELLCEPPSKSEGAGKAGCPPHP